MGIEGFERVIDLFARRISRHGSQDENDKVPAPYARGWALPKKS